MNTAADEGCASTSCRRRGKYCLAVADPSDMALSTYDTMTSGNCCWAEVRDEDKSLCVCVCVCVSALAFVLRPELNAGNRRVSKFSYYDNTHS